MGSLWLHSDMHLLRILTNQDAELTPRVEVELSKGGVVFKRLSKGLSYFAPYVKGSKLPDKVPRFPGATAIAGGHDPVQSEDERHFVDDLGVLLGLDKEECFRMLRRYIRERTEAGGNFSFFSFTDPRLRRELVSGVTKFYHDARVDMLKVVVELLRVQDDVTLPYHGAAAACVAGLMEGDALPDRLKKEYEAAHGAPIRNVDMLALYMFEDKGGKGAAGGFGGTKAAPGGGFSLKATGAGAAAGAAAGAGAGAGAGIGATPAVAAGGMFSLKSGAGAAAAGGGAAAAGAKPAGGLNFGSGGFGLGAAGGAAAGAGALAAGANAGRLAAGLGAAGQESKAGEAGAMDVADTQVKYHADSPVRRRV